jgi:hypothetical protein
VDPAGKNRCLHRYSPGVGKSLAPAVQFPLRSSDLALLVNLTARNDLETVRYYERRSLLPNPPRIASGYRLFPIEATQRLWFIQRPKKTGCLSQRDRGIVIAAGVTKDSECGHTDKGGGEDRRYSKQD